MSKQLAREIKDLRKRVNIQSRLVKYMPNENVRLKVRKEIASVRRAITLLEKKANQAKKQ